MGGQSALPRRGRLARRLLGGGQEPDPRFSLANERTFLAWIRTAMALLAGAIAVDAFSDQVFAAPGRASLAAFLAGLGLVGAGAAGLRWLEVERALRQGRPLPLPLMLPVLVVACVLLAAGLIGYQR
ncbi:YidH family protein [Pseudomonas knackmussii]|uniref:YidH family protein n=1 Tax=Pseudomonas knackmussii TaxID=65741 RepID=UPI001362F184|nr:DUF202 domain-containing protein [Pseudomonas knackmussii]